MAYFYVEDMEASSIVVHMLQVCSKYFPIPTVVDTDELKQKLENLSKLLIMWTEDVMDNSSYQSEVYKRICEMFSANVFRHSPLSSYTYEEEISSEIMWEYKQLHLVYKVFMAFINLKGFDEEKLMPYVNETFINGLIRRLNSCIEAERDCVKYILGRLFEKALYSRQYIYQGTINSLIAYGHILINGGVKELLELFKILMCHEMVDPPMIKKVLAPLMKRDGLCHYAGRLHECFETAARRVNADLPAWFVDYAIDNWTSDVPSICRTLAALYFDACGREQRRRVRGRVCGHIAGRLLATVDDAAAAAACLAYEEFCGRLIDDHAATVGDVRDAERVAEALVAVHRTHRHYGCVRYADRLLRRLVDGGAHCGLVGDACRMAVMEALVEDRTSEMTEDLVDNAF